MMAENNFLVYGEDLDLISEQIITLEQSFDSFFDEITVDLEEESIISLLEEVKTIPFLAEKKVVVVKNFFDLFVNKKIEEDLLEEFYKYLDYPNETTITIMVISKKVDESLNEFKEIKKRSSFYSVFTDQMDLETFLTNSIKEYDLSIDKNAIDLFLLLVSDFQTAKIEAEKLKTYCFGKKTITREDIDLLVPKTLETNIYDLVSAVLSHSKQKAMHIYTDMSIQSNSDSYILTTLLTKFQELYDVKKLISDGYSKDDIASIYNVKPGRAYYMIKNASECSMKEIEQSLNELSNLEAKIKQGQVDQSIALQLFLLK